MELNLSSTAKIVAMSPDEGIIGYRVMVPEPLCPESVIHTGFQEKWNTHDHSLSNNPSDNFIQLTKYL